MVTCVTHYLRSQSRAKAFVREGERAQVENSAGGKKGEKRGRGWQRGAAEGSGGVKPIPGGGGERHCGRESTTNAYMAISVVSVHTYILYLVL